MKDGITITGEHTEAEIKTTAVDDPTIKQVETLTDHEAFDKPVVIMPDAHKGAGAVIGFTMELGTRICPNTVGVDIGCGMTAANIGPAPYTALSPAQADEKIRTHIPMGRRTFRDVPVEQDYHLVNDFPWEVCEEKVESLNERWDGQLPSPDYGKDYLMDLCDRVDARLSRVIFSIGTLGGGNHFVEISRSEETGEHWVVIHSGSRSIGWKIATYWQTRASQFRSSDIVQDYFRTLTVDGYGWADLSQYVKFDLETVSDFDIVDWVQGGMGENFVDFTRLQDDFADSDPELIEAIGSALKGVLDVFDRDADLDYLEGEERIGYIHDMVFAQTYAAESRRLMSEGVADVLGCDIRDVIVSTHNYIDFEDLVIRKGATRVHEGERGVIPFNMRDGSIIVRGKGASEWNLSAPHGAGRRGSRSWAFDEFDLGTFEEEMTGIFSTSVTEETLDEAPMAYKDQNVVLDRIEETAAVVDVLTPTHNIKAEE